MRSFFLKLFSNKKGLIVNITKVYIKTINTGHGNTFQMDKLVENDRPTVKWTIGKSQIGKRYIIRSDELENKWNHGEPVNGCCWPCWCCENEYLEVDLLFFVCRNKL